MSIMERKMNEMGKVGLKKLKVSMFGRKENRGK